MEGNMPNCAIQQQLDRIAKLLDQLHAADPKAEMARRSLRGFLMPTSVTSARDVDDWPDGAVRGMLEEVVEMLWATGYLPDVLDLEDAWTGVSQAGLDWYRWSKNAALLAAALIAALEDRVEPEKGSIS